MHGTMRPLRHHIERESISSRRWHVVQVMTGQEAKVARKIDDAGMASYVPLRRVKKPARCGGNGFIPVFLGYVFAGFDPHGSLWGGLRDIDGYIRLLQINGRPASLCESAMARIREVEAMLLDYRVVVPMVAKVGAIVRLVDYGAFSGLFVPVIGLDPAARRIQVQFPFAGGDAGPWLDENQCEVL